MNKPKVLSLWDSSISVFSGTVIGFLSGLIGVGGGEYRAPVLIYLLRLSAKFAIAANLLIGLFTVAVSFIGREGWQLPKQVLLISFIMMITSPLGSYLSAHATKKLKDSFLKRSLGILLIIASIKVFLDSHSFNENFKLTAGALILAALMGFLIGGLSGFLGVAGGEFRIPTLLLIFGMGIKTAGTANLLISIPTVLFGFYKHKKLNHVDKRSIRISLWMGVFSVVGAILGASLVMAIPETTLLRILSVMMIGIGIKMTWRP
ncbi:sulfite exporter TauE/SafE family protein [Acidobacteriota bacterium]